MNHWIARIGIGMILSAGILFISSDGKANSAVCPNIITGKWSGAFGTPENPGAPIDLDLSKPTWTNVLTATNPDGLVVAEVAVQCNTWEGDNFTGTIDDSGDHITGTVNNGLDSYYLDRQPPAPISLAVGDATVSEPDEGGVITMSFAVTLTSPLTNEATVTYDFTPDGVTRQDVRIEFDTDKTITFGLNAQGETATQKVINVRVWGDSAVEDDESFVLRVLSTTGIPGGISKSEGIGTILNND